MPKISQKSYTKILIILFLISLGSFIFSLSNQKKIKNIIVSTQEVSSKEIVSPTQINKSKVIVKSETQKNNFKFTLIAGDINTKLEFVEGQTLYQVLSNGTNLKSVNLVGKDYTGMGYFVTGIGTIRESRGKYIMYSINGVEASVGISVYVPKINDVILFELK